MHGHAFVQVTIGNEPGHLGAGAHRGDDQPSDDPGDGTDEDDEDECGDEHGPLHEVERVLLFAEIAEVVQLELAGTRNLQLLSDEQPRSRAVGQAHRLVELVIGRSFADGLAELIGDGHLRCLSVFVRPTGRDRRE